MGETIKAQRGEATYPILLSWKGQNQDSDIQSNLGSSISSRPIDVRGMKEHRQARGQVPLGSTSSRAGEACHTCSHLNSWKQWSGAGLGMGTCHGPSLSKGTATEARVGTGPAGIMPYFPHNCHQFSLCSSSRSGSTRSSKATAINSSRALMAFKVIRICF